MSLRLGKLFHRQKAEGGHVPLLSHPEAAITVIHNLGGSRQEPWRRRGLCLISRDPRDHDRPLPKQGSTVRRGKHRPA
jgi:hypothetical protein